MSFDWYPWDRKAFKKKTLRLNLAQDGAYRRLIDEYMEMGGPLPDDDVALARLIGVTVDEWAAVAPAVRPFFEASHGQLINSRCEEELHAQRMLQASRAAKAKHAADARWTNYNENKDIMLRASAKHAHSNAKPMLNDATRQDIRKKEGSLATAPQGGALREPEKPSASPELQRLVVQRGWGRT